MHPPRPIPSNTHPISSCWGGSGKATSGNWGRLGRKDRILFGGELPAKSAPPLSMTRPTPEELSRALVLVPRSTRWQAGTCCPGRRTYLDALWPDAGGSGLRAPAPRSIEWTAAAGRRCGRAGRAEDDETCSSSCCCCWRQELWVGDVERPLSTDQPQHGRTTHTGGGSSDGRAGGGDGRAWERRAEEASLSLPWPSLSGPAGASKGFRAAAAVAAAAVLRCAVLAGRRGALVKGVCGGRGHLALAAAWW